VTPCRCVRSWRRFEPYSAYGVRGQAVKELFVCSCLIVLMKTAQFYPTTRRHVPEHLSLPASTSEPTQNQLTCDQYCRPALSPTICSSWQSAVYILQATFYSLQSTFYSLHSTGYILQSTFYSLQSTFYSLQSTVCSLSAAPLTAILGRYTILIDCAFPQTPQANSATTASFHIPSTLLLIPRLQSNATQSALLAAS